MKKVLLFLFASCVLLFITSCAPDISGPSDTSGTITDTSGNKKVTLHIIDGEQPEINLECLLKPTNTYASELKVGMSLDDVKNILKDQQIFCFTDYIFFCDREGRDVVIVMADGRTVQEIKIMDHIIPTHEAFESLKFGMTLIEVIEKVGLPFQSTTSGFLTCDFISEDGTLYTANWGFDSESKNYTLIEVSYYR